MGFAWPLCPRLSAAMDSLVVESQTVETFRQRVKIGCIMEGKGNGGRVKELSGAHCQLGYTALKRRIKLPY